MASTIRKTAPQRRAPEDINTWLDELGLHRQKLMLNKNIGLAVADAVLIAEIIHAKYPKLIQVCVGALAITSYKLTILSFTATSNKTICPEEKRIGN